MKKVLNVFGIILAVLFSLALIPTLITAGSEVTPSYISWHHKNKLGDFNQVLNLPTASEEETYSVNKNISIRFSPVSARRPPRYCSLPRPLIKWWSFWAMTSHKSCRVPSRHRR